MHQRYVSLRRCTQVFKCKITLNVKYVRVIIRTIRSAFVFERLLPRRLFEVTLIGLIGLGRSTFICFFHYGPEMGVYFEVGGLVT